MISAQLLTELKAIISEDRVVEAEQYHPLGNCGKVKVFPLSEEEISAILMYANEHSKSVIVEGGGTKRGFGGLCESADILLSLSEYKGIVEHEIGDMTLTVKSGSNFKVLQEYLAGHNQKIPLDPFQIEEATIGGIIAANDSGPKRLGYGSSRDAVIGLRVVYPDGKVIRTGGKVVKNVAGYDMNKLFIGSMGTLGILSEITVKLRPLPKEESLLFIRFPKGTVSEIRNISTMLLDSMLEPVSLELLSPGLSARLTNKCCFTLAVGLEEVETAVRYQEKFIRNIVPKGHEIQILSKQEGQVFWESFYSMSQSLISNKEFAVMKIGVFNKDVSKAIKEGLLVGEQHDLKVEAHGGLGHGICQINLYGDSDSIVLAIKQIRDFIANLGGYVIVKHLPFTLRKKVNIWGETPTHFFLLDAIKSKLDPKRILNPNRFVGGI